GFHVKLQSGVYIDLPVENRFAEIQTGIEKQFRNPERISSFAGTGNTRVNHFIFEMHRFVEEMEIQLQSRAQHLGIAICLCRLSVSVKINVVVDIHQRQAGCNTNASKIEVDLSF